MKRSAISTLAILSTIFFFSCGSEKQTNNAPKLDQLQTNCDSTVDPATDFFKYANGGWIKKNPIPKTEGGWGVGNLVTEETNLRLRKISEDAAATKDATKGTASQLIGDFYFSGMDSVTIEKTGVTALNEELTAINEVKDINGVLDLIARFQTYQIMPLFGIYIGQDAKNSEMMSMILYQGGLGLPNRDYYFNNDARTKNIREEYLKYMEKTFVRLGSSEADAKKSVKDLMSMETSLAAASRKLEDLRDPYKNYNKRSIVDLIKLCPAIKWQDLFAKAGINFNVSDSVIVGQPEFFTAVDKALRTVSIPTWKNYLRWQIIGSYGGKIGGEFEKENFYFFSTVMAGVMEQKPRWKRVIADENGELGEMLGQLFVKEYFSEATKTRYSNLVDAIMASYEERIKALDWMSEGTKGKSLVKLHAIKKKVGFPDHWKDFSKMNIDRGPFVRNIINANKWWWAYDVNKLGKPVDRTEWAMSPQTYNAYYDPSNNEIVLPAAIFSIPGLLDADADDAMVYGYAGASTIGHELTHGFDDQGRQYDEKGNLNDWWTKEDAKKFIAKTKLYIKQFSDYTVLDSLHVNGEATLGENIADLGGIVVALDAFKKTEQYKKGEKIGGFTPIQRYFLGYALGWMSHQRDEVFARQILTDVHSPAFLRVNGPLSNVPEFYEAFGVKEGKPMWRADSIRVKIW